MRRLCLLALAAPLAACAAYGPGPGGPPGSAAPPVVDEGRLVTVPAPEGRTIRAYVARPAGPGPHPAVVILHGTEGFSAMQTALADAFAAEGFVAVAGCWFEGRHVPPEFRAPPNLPCPNGPVFSGANFRSAANARALLDYARLLPGVRKNALALWGQSRGGTAALLLAAAGEDVRAVVAAAPIYAHPKRGGAYPDDFPIRHVAAVQVPVLMLQGTADAIIPMTEAREFEAAMRKAGKEIEAEYYEGMGHGGFYMGPEAAATRSRAARFLRRHLVGPGG